MTRILLTYVLPLVLPTAVYVAWIAYARSQHQGAPEELPALKKGPLFWCVLAGFAMMAAALAVIALSTGAPPGSRYEPPRLEDGRVVPPQYTY